MMRILPLLLCLTLPFAASAYDYGVDPQEAQESEDYGFEMPEKADYKDYRGAEHDILKHPATVYAILACDRVIADMTQELKDSETREKGALISDALVSQVEPIAIGAAIDKYGAEKAVGFPDQRNLMLAAVEKEVTKRYGKKPRLKHFTAVCYKQAAAFGVSMGE